MISSTVNAFGSNVLCVLLVEDDVAYARLLRAWLDVRISPVHISIDHVTDLTEAKAALSADSTYSSVSLDLHLRETPQSVPTFAVRELFAMPGCPPIVAITAQSQQLGANAAAQVLYQHDKPETAATQLEMARRRLLQISQQMSQILDETIAGTTATIASTSARSRKSHSPP